MNLILHRLTLCIRINRYLSCHTYAANKEVNSYGNQPLRICKALCPKITGQELMLYTPAGVYQHGIQTSQLSLITTVVMYTDVISKFPIHCWVQEFDLCLIF